MGDVDMEEESDEEYQTRRTRGGRKKTLAESDEEDYDMPDVRNNQRAAKKSRLKKTLDMSSDEPSADDYGSEDDEFD